jgi:hypothetical protein
MGWPEHGSTADTLKMVFQALGLERGAQQWPFYTATVHVDEEKPEIKLRSWWTVQAMIP